MSIPDPHHGHAILRRTTRRSGLMLMECVMYLGLVMLLVGLAMAALLMAFTQSTHLREGSDHIIKTLQAGEQWRADIRSAVGSPSVVHTATNSTLRLTTSSGGVIDYAFFDQTVWRKVAPRNDWQPLLQRVDASRFIPDQREHVRSWRWELKLVHGKSRPGMMPLFTFKAVPGFRSGL